MVGEASWKCPFPSEADGVNAASVQMRVAVDPRGHVLDAVVERDPGHGFGREATRCVRDKQWTAAADREGVAVASSVVIMVRFSR